MDPIGTKDDPNLYGYVAQDPVNKTDQTGEMQEQERSDGLRPAITQDAQSRGLRPAIIHNAQSRGLRPAITAAPSTDNDENANTLTVGISGQGTAGVVSAQAQVGVAIDSNGDVGVYVSGGIGGGLGAGGAAGLSVQTYNVPVDGLRGGAVEASGGGGIVVGGTLDGTILVDGNNRPTGTGAGVTIGLAGGETSYAGPTGTAIITSRDRRGP